ncbi:ABC transporter substrate-binding protein [Hymenobacter crusticola]|uniref:ABC transporter substrate-binding protein n=1 Tax=Hymenobacter crusticola TaxID=1770526 RepID=A0A243WIN7_9BACT|nr:ABC transporter substrate-binding protein [Hymenobacter crusticola]OUJ75763.1 ABC transporter substrate-binding protein [Hymenobacter crusticola]
MADDRIVLKGITWNHSRGFVPMTATAQRFNELHPNVDIVWEKRSLQQFADLSIQQLAEKYDLLVIDHPWAGFAARTQSILPLDEHLSAEFLADQAQNTVGHSFESYSYTGHQWALAIDAATPVASSRPDLLAQHGLQLPETYEDLLALADRKLVAFSLIPIDTLMSFYMFCSSLGEDPCQREDVVVSEQVGSQALQLFRQLASRVDPACFHRNPIQVYEAMTQTDDIAYCPFAYGYSNYSRRGYARKLLHFHDMITLNGASRLRSTLGGTGLAISAKCQHVQEAAQYAEFVASPTCQQTLYFNNGGQPGHLGAWQDEYVNHQSSNYFAATLPALQRAFLRPRYHGHMFFQDHAGEPVRQYLMNGGDEAPLLKQLNDLYRESRAMA